MIMKQTVEEAAKEYYERYKIHLAKDIFRPRIIDVFKSGAEWQKEQMIEALSSKTVEEAALQELMSSYAIVVKGEFVYQQQAMLNMFRKGAEWQKEKAIEALSSVLDNWVHGGDADCIIAEFEEKLK